MTLTLVAILVLLVLLLQLAGLWLASRKTGGAAELAAIAARLERLESALGAELARGRAEAAQSARELRGEVGPRIDSGLAAIDGRLLQTFEALRTTLDRRLGDVQEAGRAAGAHQQLELQRGFGALGDLLQQGGAQGREEQTRLGNALRQNLDELARASLEQLERWRATLDQNMARLQQSNESRLDEMRRIVDEKLHGTLEKRLGESFTLVSERLEQVHRGLGEMQSLAHGVGDLKRLMSNVKARGTWGELQLGGLLEQMLAPHQYAANVETRFGSGERVEYAIRLPGRGDAFSPVWLPVDAKLHQEDYQRLLDAQDGADPESAAVAGKALERAFRNAARTIAERYLCPPATTDFAILFVPVEGLYAEILRRPGLVDGVQRDYRVMVAGPTTLCALLSSLQMGFRTLAIEQRSSEVWEVLGAVKGEFERFGGLLDKAQKKIQEAGNVMEQARTRSRAVGKTLRAVQELPAGRGEELLGLAAPAAPVADPPADED